MEHPEGRFFLHLAETIGGMTRDELLDRMSSQEVTDWKAEFNIRKVQRENREKTREPRKSRRVRSR